ncbi:MAG TPA: hypothetical protein DCE78_03345 [Bacteroidetes bacterium]|nr:hypothetical protein [Bacteroidota bacterium]
MRSTSQFEVTEKIYSNANNMATSKKPTIEEIFLQNIETVSKVGNWIVDFKENSLYWSNGVYKLAGYEPGEIEVTFEKGVEILHPDDRDRALAHLYDVLENDIEYNIQKRFLTHKGEIKEILSKATLIRDEDGNPHQLIGIFQDITEQVIIQNSLKISENRFRALAENGADAIVIIGVDGKATYASPSIRNVLGYSEEEALSLNLFEMIHPDDLPLIAKKWEDVIQNPGVPIDGHTSRTRHKDGSWRWLEATITNMLHDPNINGIVDNFRDVTEKMYNAEQIRLSNERFEKVTSATNDAIWDYDVFSDNLFWGNGYFTQFGYDLEVVKPTLNFLISLIHPDDRERISAKIQQYMTDGISTNWFEEYRFQKSDGSYALIIDRGVFIRNYHGMVIRVVGAMTDISYRKEYEESLKELNSKLEEQTRDLIESNRELEQFAYITSHDLQEPIRMIHSFLSLLEKRYGDKLDDKARQYIHFATDGATRMRQIILDLLDFSRIGKYDDKIKPVDLNQVIKEVLATHRNRINESQALISNKGLPTLLTIESPMIQIFHNLINNALKYHRQGINPEILIEANDLGDEWQFKVTDNGMGIEPEYLEKIFVIFQRLHTREKIDGTGMGLAIVKKVIENMGGKIWVTSEVGKGSTFYFTIPKLTQKRGKKSKTN